MTDYERSDDSWRSSNISKTMNLLDPVTSSTIRCRPRYDDFRPMKHALVSRRYDGEVEDSKA